MNAPASSPSSKLKRAAANRAAINKANAQRSTGPKTVQGKTKSSLNAVKTGLTGRTVLLASDDADAYREHVNAYVAEFAPVGLRESALVQSLADHAWRLDRLVTLEMGIYAVGHAHFAEKYDNHRNVIQVRAHLAYEKQLRNLHIQESRLRRHREKDMAELQHLQEIRHVTEAACAETAAQAQAKSANSAETGFEFSTLKNSLGDIPGWPPLPGRSSAMRESCLSADPPKSPEFGPLDHI